MNKQQVRSSVPLKGNGGDNASMENRFYVQRLTDQVIVVRERVPGDGDGRSSDRIARSFTIMHDAYAYAASENDKQRKLNEQNAQQ